jgi:hypothetical protein
MRSCFATGRRLNAQESLRDDIGRGFTRMNADQSNNWQFGWMVFFRFV